MQEHILAPRGLYYRFNRWQTGRPGLVFVHGLSGSSSAWERYEKRWENKYNLLFYDLRGHGKSAKDENYRAYAVSALAGELFELIKFLGLNDFILVSHSYGGLIALEFLRHHQDLTKAAIFLSPVINVKQRPAARLLKALLAPYRIFSRLPFSREPGRRIDYSRFINTGDWNLRRMGTDIFNTGWRIYYYCLRQFYEFSGEEILKEISRPVLIISGARDTIVSPEQVRRASETIKNARLVILKKANHIIVLNNFPETAEAMENFINNV